MGAPANLRIFTELDLDTFEYIIRLKAANEFWYFTLLGCAKQSVKTTLSCFKAIKENMPKTACLGGLKPNAFQICKAVHSGALTIETLSDVITRDAWHLYRYRVAQEILKDKNSLLPGWK